MRHALRHLALSVLALQLVACDQAPDDQDEREIPVAVPGSPAAALDELAPALEPLASCKWHCQPCPPHKACIQVCNEIGNCGGACTSIAICVEGYHWDDSICACMPDGAGEACGNAVCPAGTECCNASCGICVAPGGVCTQQFCEPA